MRIFEKNGTQVANISSLYYHDANASALLRLLLLLLLPSAMRLLG
jgi:hypothetical protein